MDWAEDITGINEEDLRRVWKYEEKYSTVIRLVETDEHPVVFSLKTEKEWTLWTESDEFVQMDCSQAPSGLFLILAKRTGELEFTNGERVSSAKWLSRFEEEVPPITDRKRALTFASLAEKAPATPLNNGQRSVRTLPFSENTFRLINRKFFVHHSISAAVSRADIPTFSSADVEMEGSDPQVYHANVFTCRSTNAWEMDLALTVTHFPKHGLTFAVLFGCPLSIEQDIIKRLSRLKTEAGYPLLLPGIFSELERSRHIVVAEKMIDQLENRIYELDFTSEQTDPEDRERRHSDKREDYLDTAYLRNGLLSWRKQLMKMVECAENLEQTRFKELRTDGLHSTDDLFVPRVISTNDHAKENRIYLNDSDHSELGFETTSPISHARQMRKAGRKVLGRLASIIDEYDDKIQDCTMRLDGMAMATQWAQGETNIDIALATTRDSKHMRSIALVTMVFLPGTFFASVFSMSFFTWFNDDGSSTAQVSNYLWIYVVFTIFSTALTIGLWYYFNIWRKQKKAVDKYPLV